MWFVAQKNGENGEKGGMDGNLITMWEDFFSSPFFFLRGNDNVDSKNVDYDNVDY